MPKPWADQPIKLIPTPTEAEAKGLSKETIQVATTMALAHNVIIRNLNAIYLQAANITLPTDILDFMQFCQMTTETLHHHHSIEERYFFPVIAQYTGVPGIMEGNISQHHAFETGVEDFNKYIYKVTVEEYDGKEVRRLVDAFRPALETHLNEEIGTILGLDKYGGLKVEKAWAEVEKRAMSEIEDVSRVLPLALAGSDATFEGGKNGKFPPTPWFVDYLVKYWYGKKYKGCWRFSPSTFWGVPKELEFASDE